MSETSPSFPLNGELKGNHFCFFHIKKLSHDDEFPRREAFENVLSTLDNSCFNFVYILKGTKTGIELYVGVVQNIEETQPDSLGKKLAAVDYGEIIRSAIEGNFNGSVIEPVNNKSVIDDIMGRDSTYTDAGLITGVPSMNEKKPGEKTDFQGIDRLINSMLGLEWRLVVVCTRTSPEDIDALNNEINDLYNILSVYAKQTIQHSSNSGENFSKSENKSTAVSEQKNWSESQTKGENKNKSRNYESGNSASSGSSWTQSASKTSGTSTTETKSTGENRGWNIGRGTAVTVERSDKFVQEMMKYIDEELIERYKLGASKGLFKTSVYYMAQKPTDANRLGSEIVSLFQGNKATNCPLLSHKIDVKKNSAMLRLFQNSYTMHSRSPSDLLALRSRPHENGNVGLSTYLTASEVALIAGFPQNEVPGLTLLETVHFGLNQKPIDSNSGEIKLGCIVQNGRELENLPFYIPSSSLNKHIFVAGVTGSGKTTTCHKLLTEAKLPFLVIEPAKTEYRRLINDDENLVVFTLGNSQVAPFCLNPFELVEGENLTSHIDMLKATFTSAFPMEASMPQILEEAIYSCYKKKGWNIRTGNFNENKDDNYDEEDKYPILSDLLTEVKNVVEKKGFGKELKANYEGSLVSRLSNLTVGSKGAMLNCPYSIEFRTLANKKVVLELESIKSPEDKAFIMGLILSRLSETLKAEWKDDSSYRHITLVEEAHRLLSKPDYGDSGSKKAAVETFSDLLAEVRKYGESLIVVDQIPNKLAPDVLKNTNTKIIHRILARDDKEAVGDCMLMDDKQKAYLSALEVGNAVVFNEYTDKPVQVKIERATDTSSKDPSDEEVKSRFESKKSDFGSCYVDMEILSYSEIFAAVCEKLKENRNNDTFEEISLYQKLRENVLDIAQRTKRSVLDVYKILIERRESETGKSMASSENSKERRDKLMDFFAKFQEQKTSPEFVKSIYIYL